MRGAKAKAIYDPAADAVALSISPYPGSVFTWPQPELAIVENGATGPVQAKLMLSEDVVRALYEELGRYFGSDVVDARRLRQDYDDERGRVDKFIDALIRREAS